MRLGLSTKILFFFSLLIIVNISNFALLIIAEENAANQQNWVLHTHLVMEETEALLGHLRDAETGQRGFLLTNAESYLEPFSIGITEANNHFTMLKEMTRDNLQQQSRLDTIQELIFKKISELNITIERSKQGKHGEALSIIKSDLGKELMDSLRLQLKEFKTEEKQLLELRKNEYTDSKNLMKLIFFGEILLLLVLIIFVGFQIQRILVRPLTYLTKSIREMEEGKEVELIFRETNDEVGQLSKAFNSMRREVQERTEELQAQSHYDNTFSQIVSACSSGHNLSKVLTKALNIHSSNYPSPLAAIYLNKERSEKLHCLVTHGTSDDLAKSVSTETGLIGQVYRNNESTIIRAEAIEGFHIHTGVASFLPHTIVIEPINYGKKVIGVLVLAYTSDLQKRDLSYIGNLANQFGITVVNSRQYNSLKKLTKELEESRLKVVDERNEAIIESITDPLTGLYNRRYMQQECDRSISSSTRYGHPLSLIILDIDHFKNINDTLGHSVGDETLKALAALIKHETRDSDLLIRYGGEEFVVILPQTSIDEAEGAAEKLRKATEELDIPALNGESITISLGVAMLSKESEDMESIIVRADEALYQAKEGGRNRVCRTKTS